MKGRFCRAVRIAVSCALVGMAHAAVHARAQQRDAPAPNIDALGPQVGAGVPDFALPDQNGRTQSLRSAMGPNGMLLVFFRSADW